MEILILINLLGNRPVNTIQVKALLVYSGLAS